MTNDGNYNCTIASSVYTGEAIAHIGKEGLDFQTGKGAFPLDYANVRSFCLKAWHFFFDTPAGTLELSQMGHDTEGFYEELWLAYNSRSRESLFIETEPFMKTEGEYNYTDDGGRASGTAKLCLYPTCACIMPPDCGARRIPLCFVQDLTLDGYTIHIMLDTDEKYDLIRMGHDTRPFFENLGKFQKEAQAQWQAAHASLEANLDNRLGEALGRYHFLQDTCGKDRVISGLFSPDSSEFWVAAFGNGSVAVELITEDKSATYLYRFTGDAKVFEKRLRHAMEAMGVHREIIFMEDEALKENPLYSMSVERNAHLRFLRSCMTGRVIHTESWEKRIREGLK
jgi:hypothetical protein